LEAGFHDVVILALRGGGKANALEFAPFHVALDVTANIA
jgi:hypothetical protein